MVDREAPPYARIAAELRGRVERGELVPGDRMPSTREISRTWGVAIATATKVITALRQDGVVRTVPGVGTVVAAPSTTRPPRRRAEPAAGLTAGRIVAAAVAIADAEGLDGLSMRRVATDLGAGPMSLYRHVADKDDLLLQMMDAVMRQEWQPPASPPAGWRAQLELAGRTLWTAFRRHPWLAPALSLTRPQPIAGGMAYTEWVLTALDGLGLDLPAMFDVHLTVFNYARGTAVNLEPEAAAQAVTGLDNEQWMETQEAALRSIVGTGDFPHFERILSMDFDLDLDVMFERGLGYLLDGLRVALDTPNQGAVPPL